MTTYPISKTMTLFMAGSLLVGLTLLAPGCSDECDSNTDCESGQYCDTEKGVCTLDCREDKDCPGGTCNTLGKCVGGSTDAGPPREAGPDQTTPDMAPREASPDLPTPDLWPAKEQTVKPDLFKKPDQFILNLDLYPQPDTLWPFDGPKPDLPDAGAMVPGLWTSISAGMFMMGSPKGEPCREPATGGKETQHQVTLTSKFVISTTEVTQAQFTQMMQYSPSSASSCGTNCPVENVSWHEAAAYCNALSTLAKLTQCYNCSGKKASVSCSLGSAYSGSGIYKCKGYRLPTEAEWEYAARGGQYTALYSGQLSTCSGIDSNANAIAWYLMNASNKPHPVSQKKANNWGLYDMSGNIFEWVNDWDQKDLGSNAVQDPGGPGSGTKRIIRGGSWLQPASFLRSASRLSVVPAGRTKYVGFRCARTVSP